MIKQCLGILLLVNNMLSKIKRLKKSLSENKDHKTLANNFKYLMILQIAGYIFPLLTLPYLARVIGVEGFGKIAFAVAVIIWFQTITDWGFNYTATRDLAQNRNDREKVSEIFSNVLWSKIFLGIISFILLLILILIIPFFYKNKDILLLTFLLVPANILYAEWFFQAIEKMKYITILSLISKFLFTIMVFLVIREKNDYIYQPLLISLGSIMVGLVSFYIIVAKWGVSVKKPKYSEVRNTIKNSKDVFINNIVHNLYNSFSSVLVGFFGGSISNGILDAGTRFVNMANQFMSIIARVFFPFLSRSTDKHDIFCKINISLAIISSLILFFISPYLIKLFFTEEFSEAILVLKIMSFMLIFSTINNAYGINYMIIKGYEKDLRKITFNFSILGFILAFPLVYYFDYIGAAVNILSIRALIGLTVMYRAKKIKKKIDFGSLV